ncbi:hypothetical protein ATN06_21465 [Bacillus thuringiensis]|nr:hypothetical protein ATN06_21465 [Bacillus thuringiensis]
MFLLLLCKTFVLQVLAPFQTFRLKVAGFHRAFPSTALNKSCLYYFIYVAKRKYVPLLTMFVNFLINLARINAKVNDSCGKIKII